MTHREQVMAEAFRALDAARLRAVFEAIYDAAYKEGDLDRQRMERAVIKPTRKRARPPEAP